MHRHLNEELRTVSREEELLGKALACCFRGFPFPSGVLSTGGRSSARSLALLRVTARSCCQPCGSEGKEELYSSPLPALHQPGEREGAWKGRAPPPSSTIIFLFTRLASKHLWIVFFPSLCTVSKTSMSFFFKQKANASKKKNKPKP